MKLRISCVFFAFLSVVLSMAAQTTENANAAASPTSSDVTTTGGTANKIPMFTTATNIQNSIVTQTGTTGVSVAGKLTATGAISGSRFQIGSDLFVFGSYSNGNAFLGFAGNTTTTGTNDTASGYQALESNTTGALNTASGVGALYSNTSGGLNTASGFAALYSNTTGDYNTANGLQALFSNTTGSYNTASGVGALNSNINASDNDAFGAGALFSNTTGTLNDAFGYQALHSNTLGSQNEAFGFQALYSNVGDSVGDGWLNTAVGYQALYMNNDTSGSGSYANLNVAVGYQALYSNTTGYWNVASGGSALYSNTTGIENTAVGTAALGSNTTGIENTAVGYGALGLNQTGNDLMCVGYECTAGADGLRNAAAIGAHAVVSESNSLVLGGTGEWAVKVGIGTTTPSNILTIERGAGHPVSDGWETFSSRRWKTNIQTLHGALGKVEQLRGVSYDLKDSGKHEIGVIAEEVGQVVPEVVSYEKNSKDATGVDYSRLTALLIEATKEQQREIQQQQAVLRTQAAALRDLKSELRATRQTLQKVKAQVAAAQPALVAAK